MDLSDMDIVQDNPYNMLDKQCWLAQCDSMEKVTVIHHNFIQLCQDKSSGLKRESRRVMLSHRMSS